MPVYVSVCNVFNFLCYYNFSNNIDEVLTDGFVLSLTSKWVCFICIMTFSKTCSSILEEEFGTRIFEASHCQWTIVYDDPEIIKLNQDVDSIFISFNLK